LQRAASEAGWAVTEASPQSRKTATDAIVRKHELRAT